MAVLTQAQVLLVRESYALVLERSDRFAESFYDRLFHDHPFVRALFSDDMTRRANALTATLTLVVASLDDLPPILPTLRELAKRHVGYGVRPDHYPIIGAALIDTFADILDTRLSPDTRAAWTIAYDVMATAMIAAAYPRDDQAETDSSAG